MKQAIYSLIFLCLISSVNVQAQKTKPATTPVKGYYSIGRNAEKLSLQKQSDVSAVTAAYPLVSKGYYATGSNNQKLGKKLMGGSAGVQPAIKITKGYYSIGANAGKLK